MVTPMSPITFDDVGREKLHGGRMSKENWEVD